MFYRAASDDGGPRKKVETGVGGDDDRAKDGGSRRTLRRDGDGDPAICCGWDCNNASFL